MTLPVFGGISGSNNPTLIKKITSAILLSFDRYLLPVRFLLNVLPKPELGLHFWIKKHGVYHLAQISVHVHLE